jgi:hypothetical protein
LHRLHSRRQTINPPHQDRVITLGIEHLHKTLVRPSDARSRDSHVLSARPPQAKTLLSRRGKHFGPRTESSPRVCSINPTPSTSPVHVRIAFRPR